MKELVLCAVICGQEGGDLLARLQETLQSRRRFSARVAASEARRQDVPPVPFTGKVTLSAEEGSDPCFVVDLAEAGRRSRVEETMMPGIVFRVDRAAAKLLGLAEPECLLPLDDWLTGRWDGFEVTLEEPEEGGLFDSVTGPDGEAVTPPSSPVSRRPRPYLKVASEEEQEGCRVHVVRLRPRSWNLAGPPHSVRLSLKKEELWVERVVVESPLSVTTFVISEWKEMEGEE